MGKAGWVAWTNLFVRASPEQQGIENV